MRISRFVLLAALCALLLGVVSTDAHANSCEDCKQTLKNQLTTNGIGAANGPPSKLTHASGAAGIAAAIRAAWGNLQNDPDCHGCWPLQITINGAP